MQEPSELVLEKRCEEAEGIRSGFIRWRGLHILPVMPETGDKRYDVIIAGAGPAGAACAIRLAMDMPELSIALLDRHTFPRDKICGDALSPDVVNQLAMLSPELTDQLRDQRTAHPIEGIKVFGRKGSFHTYFFRKRDALSAYTCPRYQLDAMLVSHTSRFPNITFMAPVVVEDVILREDRIEAISSAGSISAHMIIGADGAHSAVARKMGRVPMDRDYHAGGIRVYYEGVQGLDEGLIELHFLPDLIPGYLWIFPLPHQRANVGLGMASDQIADGRINLRDKLQEVVQRSPELRERFKHARALENIKGYGLPLGGKNSRISGERFLLVGDAASLIDPLTGEGIGNAIRSGRIAAEHIQRSMQASDFSSVFNEAYDREVYRRMMPELNLDDRLRRLIRRFPWSIDLSVWMANRMSGLRRGLLDYYIGWHKKSSK